MNSSGYVWEKMYTAIDCLCSDGPFISRLKDATVSALNRLEVDDLSGELAEDLKFVLDWTKHNIADGKIQREPNDLEREHLVEKMLHIMLETYQK